MASAFDGPLPPLTDGEDLGPLMDAGAHDGTHRGVHALGIAARGHDADARGHLRAPLGRTTFVACQSAPTFAVFVSESPAMVTPSATELGPMKPGLPTFGVSSQM